MRVSKTLTHSAGVSVLEQCLPLRASDVASPVLFTASCRNITFYRCQTAFWGKGVEVNLYLAFLSKIFVNNLQINKASVDYLFFL